MSELPPPPPGSSGWPWTEAPAPPAGSASDGPPRPSVSVVTPSYNQGRFIEATIRSVLLQGYPDLQYLVLDGGSTDGTVGILRRYPQLEWVSEPDSGQSAAINKGFRRARGEIIGWLNSDDTYRPGAVEAAASFLQANPEVDLVYSNCYAIDETGEVMHESRPREYNYARLLDVQNMIPQPTVFFRRRILDEVGCLDESLHYAMDLDYWLRIGKRHRITKVEGFHACFRLHGSSKSVAEHRKFYAEVRRVTRRHGGRFFSRYFTSHVRQLAGKDPLARLVTLFRETARELRGR